MISIDEMQALLDEIAQQMPEAFFERLNGGIVLLPQTKQDRRKGAEGLFIMGEYHRGGSMGRYIAIYYGSFTRVYGHLPKEELTGKLTDTLKHEFTHHLESLAGERDLEVEDERFLADYMSKRARERR